MKLTSKILTAMLLLFIAGLFLSNTILKKEFNKTDKSDLYWNYGILLQQPFSHINIIGGNNTNIAFEQNNKASVKVYKNWDGYANGLVKAFVKNDTLCLIFPKEAKDIFERDWMKWNTLVRIFSPNLISVTGEDTKFVMFNMKQKSIHVIMNGKSEFELESMDTEFETLNVQLSDSSAVVFEMSPDYKLSTSFHIKNVEANVQGYSILDLGHAQIGSLKLTIADSSGILLSGKTLSRKLQ